MAQLVSNPYVVNGVGEFEGVLLAATKHKDADVAMPGRGVYVRPWHVPLYVLVTSLSGGDSHELLLLILVTAREGVLRFFFVSSRADQ